MQFEDSFHFFNRDGVPIGPMAAGDDDLALCAVQMGAPVGHDAVGEDRRGVIFVSALATICDNGVIGYASGGWYLVQRGDEAILGIECVDAIGGGFEDLPIVSGFGKTHKVMTDRIDVSGAANEPFAHATDEARSHFAAAEGGGHENDTRDFIPVTENES